MLPADWVLTATAALAWYHVGFVWLVQVVAWPLFAYVGHGEFDAYHRAWWRGIRYILFVPSALVLLGALSLLRTRPPGVPAWPVDAALGLYALTYVLTAVWWGPQQAALTDPASARFGVIVRTHWVRTALVTGTACCFSAALLMRAG